MDGDPHDVAFLRDLESHKARTWMGLMRHLPADPRCAICHAPYGGLAGRVLKRMGFGPSRKNPRLCSTCFEKAPMGAVQMEVGVLFADVRGFTALSEQRSPAEVTDLLNRFYAAAVDVLCRHAIIDKLVGDQVMALYLPTLFAGDTGEHMLEDARALLDAADPWIDIGIGLDHGAAQVGNVGAGAVKDFTAIGDVVNTAARLQAAAGAGQIVASRNVATGEEPGAVAQSLVLKGKSEPVEAVVITPTRSSPAACS